MNEELTKHYTLYIFRGLEMKVTLGTYMHVKYFIEGEIHIPSVYAGRDYDYKGNPQTRH